MSLQVSGQTCFVVLLNTSPLPACMGWTRAPSTHSNIPGMVADDECDPSRDLAVRKVMGRWIVTTWFCVMTEEKLDEKGLSGGREGMW